MLRGIAIPGDASGRLFFAFIGTAGDLPWQAKVWRQTRHFECDLCCPYCKITKDDIADLNNVSDEGQGHQPWDHGTLPLLLGVPGFNRMNMYRHDIFHLGPLGIARRFYCSALVLLCDWGFFEGRDLASRLRAAYGNFRSYCAQVHETPLVKEFTLSNIGRGSSRSYPDCSFKASDGKLIMDWLQEFLDKPWQFDGRGVLKCLFRACCDYNDFFRL